jgi:hypothetical protein
MYAGSQVLDGQRVEIRRSPADGFANPIYLDPLTQYFNGALYRLWPNERYFSKGGSRLHRDVWEFAFGEIPLGHHIHHRDGNPVNNSISNLECMEATEHLKLTWKEHKEGKQEHFTVLAREKATQWHKSDEGRLWHSRMAKRSESWKKWKRDKKPCVWCGKEFDALIRKSGNAQKFCHPNCKAAHYRNNKANSAEG